MGPYQGKARGRIGARRALSVRGLISDKGRRILRHFVCMECAGRLTRAALSTLAAASSINIEDGGGMPSKKKKKSVRARDYDVGYGKPPKGSQYKRGQSGNPGGRPPIAPPPPPKEAGLAELEAAILVTLRGRVAGKSGGKTRKVNALDALARKLLAQALDGDMRATRTLLDLYHAAEAREAHILAAERKRFDPLVFAALTEALLGSKRNALDSDALADRAPSGGDGETANVALGDFADEIGLGTSRSHLEPDGCTVEGSLTNATPELITPIPEVHSQPLPLPKPRRRRPQ